MGKLLHATSMLTVLLGFFGLVSLAHVRVPRGKHGAWEEGRKQGEWWGNGLPWMSMLCQLQQLGKQAGHMALAESKASAVKVCHHLYTSNLQGTDHLFRSWLHNPQRDSVPVPSGLQQFFMESHTTRDHV